LRSQLKPELRKIQADYAGVLDRGAVRRLPPERTTLLGGFLDIMSPINGLHQSARRVVRSGGSCQNASMQFKPIVTQNPAQPKTDERKLKCYRYQHSNTRCRQDTVEPMHSRTSRDNPTMRTHSNAITRMSLNLVRPHWSKAQFNATRNGCLQCVATGKLVPHTTAFPQGRTLATCHEFQYVNHNPPHIVDKASNKLQRFVSTRAKVRATDDGEGNQNLNDPVT